MGKFEKYFCCGVSRTLICVGVVMSVLSFATSATNFVLTIMIVIETKLPGKWNLLFLKILILSILYSLF
jgi:hypothetical protein